MQRLSRRYGQTITADRAIAFGIDREVLQRMIADAALDDRAHSMKLGLSDTAIANALLTDPNFLGADGKFDRARFNEALRASGYTEAAFISEQRALDLRQHIIQGLSGLDVLRDRNTGLEQYIRSRNPQSPHHVEQLEREYNALMQRRGMI